MKVILNKIYFHPIFIIIIFIFVLIGYFKFIMYFMLLIIIHEIGHILVAMFYKWKIDKIIILPFGAITKFNTIINIPLIEEFLVSIFGMLFQMIFFILVKKHINYPYFSIINYLIIIFNLLPIYPLDGSKILLVLFNMLFSFKTSIKAIIIISYILIVSLLIFSFFINKIFVVVLILLLIELYKLNLNFNYIFTKFLLERYLRVRNFKNIKIIDKISNMKKDYKHIFVISKKYVSEEIILDKMFDNNNNL